MTEESKISLFNEREAASLTLLKRGLCEGGLSLKGGSRVAKRKGPPKTLGKGKLPAKSSKKVQGEQVVKPNRPLKGGGPSIERTS